MNENEKKEIEEMAKVICGVACDYENCEICPFNGINIACEYHDYAINLIKAGYRNCKDKVVLSREEWESLTNDLDKHDYGEFENGYSQGYKQAHKEMLKDCIESNKKAEQIGYEKGSKETAEKIYNLSEECGAGVLFWKKVRELVKELGVEIKD